MGLGLEEWHKDSRGNNIPLLHVGKVIDNSDPEGTGRLLVRILGADRLDDDKALIECFPLLPKYLNIFPKVGEAVFIQQFNFMDTAKFAQNAKRFWIGPIISQLQNLPGQGYVDALSINTDGYKTPDQNLDTIPESKGAYPNKDDVAFQGRDNTDIIFKPKEVQIRAGKFEPNDVTSFNKKNPAYIQLKLDNNDIVKEFENEEVENTIFVPPTHNIKATMDIVTSNGTNLSDNLTADEYNSQQGVSYFVNITVKDIKTGDIVFTYDNGGSGFTSFDAAITNINSNIQQQQNDYPKWKLSTTISEVLNKFGKDNGEESIIYPSSTRTETKTIKKLKIKKVQRNDSGTVVNIVGDKINLISHKGEHNFDLTDPEKMITNETQTKINSDAHPLVYGDKLLEFLELLKEYVKIHVHAYHGLPSNDETSKINLLNFDLDTILNKNINSN
jgi:hypothetical protein